MSSKWILALLLALVLAISALPVCALQPESVDHTYINGYAENLAYPRYAYSNWEHRVYVLTIVLIILLSLLVISFLGLAVAIYVLYDDTSLLEETSRKSKGRNRRQPSVHPGILSTDSSAPYFPMPAVPAPLMMSGSATMRGPDMHAHPLQMHGHPH